MVILSQDHICSILSRASGTKNFLPFMDPPPQPSPAMEEEGPVQSLSDEVLLKIFSNITDAKTLLDGVALVCRRWNALAREPQAWGSVELTLDDEANKRRRWSLRRGGAGGVETNLEDVENQQRRERRCLLHAPALRSLILRPCEEEWPSMLSALRRSRVQVTDTLRITCGSQWDQDAASGVLAVVWRSRRRLRELTVSLRGQRSCLCVDHGDGRSLMSMLPAMPELRRLFLSLDANARPVPAACAPGRPVPSGPPPRLRELLLGMLCLPRYPYCVIALLRRTAPSLRSLFLVRPLPPRPRGKLEAALALAAGLRDVHLNNWLPPGSVLAAWTSLESLTLEGVGLPWDEELSQLRVFLEGCARIGSLRRLRGLFMSSILNGDRPERCKELVDAFKQARPDVDVDLWAHNHGHKKRLS